MYFFEWHGILFNGILDRFSSHKRTQMMKQAHDLAALRHSAAHLLAHAVQELFPDTILTIGPATAEGFFYDFLPTQSFKEDDLPRIEARMHEIAARNLTIDHTQEPKSIARKRYAHNRFKLELIEGIAEDEVGCATQGDFVDLCRGGHVNSTSDIAHFKLLTISGSYWRADRNGQPLQRITGTAFFTQEDLDAFLKMREDALMYDHRRLGKELDLFSFHEEGLGFPFFHPKGKRVLNIMARYLRELYDAAGYSEIQTPTMLNDQLWKQSGHYDHYKDNMYFCQIDTSTFAIKPMNCPGAILVYNERPRSYRELPLRLAEFGHVHRYEISGALHGLFRVRAFTQDDAHIFCTTEQIKKETMTIIRMAHTVFEKFGFSSIGIRLSTKPAKAMGSDELWQQATDALRDALISAGLPFTVEEGEGAFYGPKIDLDLQDSMNRSWQCGTIQLDFFQPENFDLSYIGNEGKKVRPIMIHRAIYGSFERFFGMLLEHHKGRLPFWLAPVQMRVLTITDEQKTYAQQIATTIAAHGLRIDSDESSDPIAGKIKSAQLARIPWMLVLGKKEAAAGTVALRDLDGKQEFGITIDDLITRAKAHN